MSRRFPDASRGSAHGHALTGPAPADTALWLLRLIRRALRAALGRLLLWHDRAAQRRQLLMMDDRMLKDIGLTRADINAESDKPFWRP